MTLESEFFKTMHAELGGNILRTHQVLLVLPVGCRRAKQEEDGEIGLFSKILKLPKSTSNR